MKLQNFMAEDLPYGTLWRADVIDPVSDKFEDYMPAMGGISSWISQWSYPKAHLKRKHRYNILTEWIISAV